MTFRRSLSMISALCGALFLSLIFSSTATALTLTEGPTVKVQDNKATITWTTDVVCGSKVNYGLKPDALDQHATGFLAQRHSVEIEGLKPSTVYFFTVASAREKLGSGSFNASGSSVATTAAPSVRSQAGKPTPPSKPALPSQPPPTRLTWGYLGSLQDHFDRHGHDFQAKSPDDYAAQAWLFLQRAKREGLPAKLDTDGTIRVWDSKTGTFAAYNRDGTTKTFFKPGNSGYWQRQPGRILKPNEFPQQKQPA